MASPDTTWKVLAHEPIEVLAENLWWVRGALPGMSLLRNMTVVRLGDGRLVIHNAIALDDAGMRALESWGTPAFLLVPSAYHRLDAARFKHRYPGMVVLAPRGARARVEAQVHVDGGYEDLPADDTVQLEYPRGLGEREGAMRVRSDDGLTVVLNDSMFNMDVKKDLPGYLITTLFGSAPGPRVSRLSKLAIVKDASAFRAELERYAALPDLVRVIVAHEKVARGADASAALRQAATYL
jgi:hypothetical protein